MVVGGSLTKRVSETEPWSHSLAHPGCVLFVMYTTPLSTLISSCSLNHHLYADDTQLFLSFLPTHLVCSIDHLHNALDRISSWMSANLLTLNSSKTEFVLIGLSKQLPKINNSSLTTTHSARNLGFIFDEHLTFSHQISSVSKSCYYHRPAVSEIVDDYVGDIYHIVKNLTV